MLSSNQWQKDMADGVDRAVRKGVMLLVSAWNLRASILEPINETRMNKDTYNRLHRGE